MQIEQVFACPGRVGNYDVGAGLQWTKHAELVVHRVGRRRIVIYLRSTVGRVSRPGENCRV